MTSVPLEPLVCDTNCGDCQKSARFVNNAAALSLNGGWRENRLLRHCGRIRALTPTRRRGNSGSRHKKQGSVRVNVLRVAKNR